MLEENYEKFIGLLEQRLRLPLPGKNAQKRMMPDIREPDLQYFTNKQLRKAAVLICLFPFGDSIGTILIERTQDSSPHSGQIAFPGGKYEESDRNQIITALREANEEVGINAHAINVIGNLSPIEIPVSGFSVLPVVGYLSHDPEVIPCLNEVQSYFKISLLELINNKNKGNGQVFARQRNITTPFYNLENHKVWGATAMVLSELEDILKSLN